MKNFLALIFVLSLSFTYAQPGGGGGGGMGGSRQGSGGMGQQGGGTQARQEMPEFKASEVAGIFSYDDDEALKKIKIKKKQKELILDVRKAIDTYNYKIQEIALLNKDNFDTLNVFMNTIIKSSMASRGQRQQGSNSGMQRGGDENQSNGGRDVMRKAMALSKEKIEPAKEAVNKEEIKLNAKLESILNEKQYGKWLKYQEKVKEDMQPKTPSNNGQGGQNRNQGGGMGGPPGGGGMR